MKPIQGYKGFDKDFKCKDTQYKVGETVKHDGKVKACSSGLHFCEHPLDVFAYYSPADSRFAEVEGSGNTDRHNEDSKIACSEIHVKAEISFHAMIEAAVKFVFDRAKWTKEKTVSKEKAGAVEDGYSGAASATGNRGAASATGDRGAASATGKHGIASSLGIFGKAKGALGVWLVLSEWEEDNKEEYGWKRKTVKTSLVDGKKIKADVYYTLKAGKFVEAE